MAVFVVGGAIAQFSGASPSRSVLQNLENISQAPEPSGPIVTWSDAYLRLQNIPLSTIRDILAVHQPSQLDSLNCSDKTIEVFCKALARRFASEWNSVIQNELTPPKFYAEAYALIREASFLSDEQRKKATDTPLSTLRERLDIYRSHKEDLKRYLPDLSSHLFGHEFGIGVEKEAQKLQRAYSILLRV